MYIRRSAMASKQDNTELKAAKDFKDLLRRLQENLTRAIDKNDTLLEALETSEARILASSDSDTSEVTLLKNIRARLAASHTPNSALRRDLPVFSGLFGKRFNELEAVVKANQETQLQLTKERKDLKDEQAKFEQLRKQFETERAEWKQELDVARNDIVEQNDRLTVLSQQLTGTKHELDVKTNELKSQRIAFEEEKLVRETIEITANDTEAESLRRKLRNQVLKNVELENSLLKTELLLHQTREESDAHESRNARLKGEIQQLRLTSSRAVKQFEKRTSEANKRLAEMNTELSKAQEHARRFQEVLAVERRKQKTLQHAIEQQTQAKAGAGVEVLPPTAQKAYIDALTETLGVTNKPKNLKTVDDVLRKNEVVLVENAHLKAEIRKLRVENSDLLRRVRFADSNAHYMRNQVLTNLYDRADLMKKLDKAEQQYQELQTSLTKQANDWVRLKRKSQDAEKTTRWSQIEPVPVLGASERTWNVPQRAQTTGRATQVQKW